MTRYKLGDHIVLLLPITYYISIDVSETITLDDVTYIRSTFEVVGIVLLNDMNVGYRIKEREVYICAV